MEDLILSLDPAVHRVERYLLWQNRYVSILAFALGHGIFYAIARAGLRPFCAISIVLFIFHLLDCIKKKRSYDEEKNCSQLTQIILQSYRNLSRRQEAFQTIKFENRRKYSFILTLICLAFAWIGMKITGFYISYFVMFVLFTFPAIKYHHIIPKVLKRLAPILEQLDQSMEYKRRSLIDRKDLLVKFQSPGLNEEEEEESEQKPSNLKESGFDMLNDTSSSSDDRDKDRLNIQGGTESDLSSFDFLNEYEE